MAGSAAGGPRQASIARDPAQARRAATSSAAAALRREGLRRGPSIAEHLIPPHRAEHAPRLSGAPGAVPGSQGVARLRSMASRESTIHAQDSSVSTAVWLKPPFISRLT